MPNIGYQDWQRVQYSSGSRITSVAQVITSAVTLGPLNVQNWNSLIIGGLSGAGDNYGLLVQWYSDAGVTLMRMSAKASVSGQSNFMWSVPCVGPYCNVIINPQSNTAFAATTATVVGSMLTPPPGALKDFDVSSINVSQALTSNQTVTTAPLKWYTGDALLDVFTSLGASCTVELDFQDINTGITNRILQVAIPGSGLINPNRIYIPPHLITAKFVNGATAQTANLNLTPMYD